MSGWWGRKMKRISRDKKIDANARRDRAIAGTNIKVIRMPYSSIYAVLMG